MPEDFIFSIWNSRLLQWLRMDFQLTSSSCLKKRWFLAIHAYLSYFHQNMAKEKMEDAYYLETNFKGTGSVIIIANDQLRDTPGYLLSLLLEIVTAAVRWVLKTGYHNFKKNSFILTALFITCKEIPCYMRESTCKWLIVKNIKISQSYDKHFWIFPRRRKCRILIGLYK